MGCAMDGDGRSAQDGFASTVHSCETLVLACLSQDCERDHDEWDELDVYVFSSDCTCIGTGICVCICV